MAIEKEAYSSGRVDKIYQLIKNEHERGTPRQYDIKVDGLKVISRTSEPDRFYDYEEFVMPETRNVTINLYDGVSNRCTRYHLLLCEEPLSKQELSGIEKSFNSRISLERDKWKYEQLKKDYDDLQDDYDETIKSRDQLMDKVDELKAELEKNKSSSGMADKFMTLAGILVSANPKALNGIPIIGQLLGGGSSNKQAEETTEATFSGADAPSSAREVKKYKEKLEPKDIEDLTWALIPFFKEPHLSMVDQILAHLHHYTDLIPEVLKKIELAISGGTPPRQEKKNV